jgi:hypothetical protein
MVTVAAAAAAAPALVQPQAWFVACALAALALLGIAAARGQVANKGTADVVVVPARIAGRLALGVVNPVNWLKAAFGAVGALAAGALAAALTAAVQWMMARGTGGILAAIRMGAWTHAPAWGTTVGCFLLLRGVGRTRDRRAVAVRRAFARLPETVVAAVVFCVVLVGVSTAIVNPRLDALNVGGDDGLGFVPVGLRSNVDGLRDDVVGAELDALGTCLDDGQAGRWTTTYSAGNALGEPDVATLVAGSANPPTPGELAVAALAAHNQLAPWVEFVDIGVGDQMMLRVERRGFAHDAPVTDGAVLTSHTVGAPPWSPGAVPAVDSHAVLRCSARTPW